MIFFCDRLYFRQIQSNPAFRQSPTAHPDRQYRHKWRRPVRSTHCILRLRTLAWSLSPHFFGTRPAICSNRNDRTRKITWMQHTLYTMSLGIFRLFPQDITARNAATESATSNTFAGAEEVRCKNQKWTW